MQAATDQKLNIRILKIDSPVRSQRNWQIESFCLKIFEYTDYSLRRALAGELNELQCSFFIAESKGDILVVAGCLYSMSKPSVAILGPVCTDPQYRKNGLAFELCGMLLEQLRAQKIGSVYLGVKDNIPAVKLYKKLGFLEHSGIVMRKLFISKDEFDNRYLSGQQTIIRQLQWSDFPEISVLLCEPAYMFSFDFCQQIFSAKYVEIPKFLPVFPTLMSCIEKHGGIGAVLQTKENKSIVGTAFLKMPPSKLQDHIAILEFFILDGFVDNGEDLVRQTIKQSGLEGCRTILCYCPECDIYKKQILLSLGAQEYAVLPSFVRINDNYQKIIVFTLKGSKLRD